MSIPEQVGAPLGAGGAGWAHAGCTASADGLWPHFQGLYLQMSELGEEQVGSVRL